MRAIEVSEQIGGAQFDEVIELGALTVRELLEKFDQKPWAEESRTSQETELCAPTLSISDSSTDEMFWVSPYLSGEKLYFVNEYRYRLRQPTILSKLFAKTHKAPRTSELTLDQARDAIEHFARGNHEELLVLVTST